MGSELAETQNWGLDSPAPVSLMSLYLSSCSKRTSETSVGSATQFSILTAQWLENVTGPSWM